MQLQRSHSLNFSVKSKTSFQALNLDNKQYLGFSQHDWAIDGVVLFGCSQQFIEVLDHKHGRTIALSSVSEL